MLVITRREGEEVVIGDPHHPIGVVRVVGIKGDRVRLAFEFPRDVDVHRREVAIQIIEAALAGGQATRSDSDSDASGKTNPNPPGSTPPGMSGTDEGSARPASTRDVAPVSPPAKPSDDRADRSAGAGGSTASTREPTTAIELDVAGSDVARSGEDPRVRRNGTRHGASPRHPVNPSDGSAGLPAQPPPPSSASTSRRPA